MGMNNCYNMDDIFIRIIYFTCAVAIVFAIIYAGTHKTFYKYEDMDGNIGIAEDCSNSTTKWMGKYAFTESSVLNCQVGNKIIMVKWYEKYDVVRESE
jgi:hypothetical protein